MHVSKELAELKNELAKFRNETKQHLDLIEYGLNKQVSLNYIRAVIDYMSKTTNDLINSLDCPAEKQTELECKKYFVDIQQRYVDKLKTGRIAESNKALVEVLDLTAKEEKKMAEEQKPCAECHHRLGEVLAINKTLVDELQMLATPSVESRERLEVVNRINPTELKENILDPISHEARLRIMLSIFNGGGRFSDFIQSTGLNGGHLLYHVSKLIKCAFIQKCSSRDYMLTSKGIRTLLLLAQLSKERQASR